MFITLRFYPGLMSLRRRTNWHIMQSVISALCYRELKMRMGRSRIGWFWILAEPIAQIVILALIWSARGREMMPGVSIIMFLFSGFAAFNMINSVQNKCRGAITANQGLFVYKQVKPLDAFIARALVEGAVLLSASVILLCCISLVGFDVHLVDPLKPILALLLAWFLGVSLGVFFGVFVTLYEDFGKIVPWILRPMVFISGVIFPIQSIPEQYHHILYWNPYLHIVELCREGFFTNYPSVFSDLSVPIYFSLCFLSLGMLFYHRFRFDLVMSR